MKFTKTNSPNDFQPVIVSFTIETKDEYDVIRCLLGYHSSISAVGGCLANSNEFTTRKKFIEGIRDVMDF